MGTGLDVEINENCQAIDSVVFLSANSNACSPKPSSRLTLQKKQSLSSSMAVILHPLVQEVWYKDMAVGAFHGGKLRTEDLFGWGTKVVLQPHQRIVTSKNAQPRNQLPCGCTRTSMRSVSLYQHSHASSSCKTTMQSVLRIVTEQTSGPPSVEPYVS